MVSRDGAGAVAEYVDEVEEKACVIPAQSALMFCYFNNNQYFHKYLDQYQGLCVLSSALLIITSHVRRHLCDSDWPHRWRPTLRPRARLSTSEKMEISRSGGTWPPSTCWGVQGALIIQCPAKNRGQKLLKFKEARYVQLC